MDTLKNLISCKRSCYAIPFLEVSRTSKSVESEIGLVSKWGSEWELRVIDG